MWFDSWSDIARVLVVGAAAYATLVLVLRLTGKRTLAELNAFDLDGTPVEHALRSQRVTMSEVRQAVRAAGTGDLSSVAAVVLESDGSLSVITSSKAGDRSALEDVDR